jgi:murein DD-endopeptidase MepM/ murein hydrolase activator NlpD
MKIERRVILLTEHRKRLKNFAFIPIQKQNPDSKTRLKREFENRAIYRDSLKPQSGRALLAVVASFLLFFPSSAAYAGILSFMGGIFADLHFSKEFIGVPVNSQTMALLEAVRNSDPSPDPDSAEVTIVNDSAILAQSAPDQSAGSGVTPASDQISVYVVRKGDTLSAIAKMFGVSANTILWANDIPKGGTVRLGQKLVILPVSGVQHTVKKGDTVVKLAALYKADADEIRGANDMEDDEKLTVGDIIVIPNGVETEAPSVSPIKTIKKAIGSLVDGSSAVSTNGYFVRPTAGKKTQGIHGHNGVDFHAAKGTAVVASAAGVVVVSRDSGWNGGYGQYVVIKHGNGMQTLYAHLSNNIVSEGQEVSQGQLVGYSGDTGKSFGPHLHFEVRGGRNPF